MKVGWICFFKLSRDGLKSELFVISSFRHLAKICFTGHWSKQLRKVVGFLKRLHALHLLCISQGTDTGKQVVLDFL